MTFQFAPFDLLMSHHTDRIGTAQACAYNDGETMWPTRYEDPRG
jgi:hypothetical protein